MTPLLHQCAFLLLMDSSAAANVGLIQLRSLLITAFGSWLPSRNQLHLSRHWDRQLLVRKLVVRRKTRYLKEAFQVLNQVIHTNAISFSQPSWFTLLNLVKLLIVCHVLASGFLAVRLEMRNLIEAMQLCYLWIYINFWVHRFHFRALLGLWRPFPFFSLIQCL
jgi:hypothetical protein